MFDEPIYQNHPNIKISADELTLMQQVRADIEPLIGMLYEDNRLSLLKMHVTTGLCIIDGWHKDGSTARTAIGTGLVKNTEPKLLAKHVVDKLLQNMGKKVDEFNERRRKHVGDLWLPNY